MAAASAVDPDDLRAFYALPDRGIYAYAAYWDDRLDLRPVIRITGLRLNTTSLNGSQCLIRNLGDNGTTMRTEASTSDIYTDWPTEFRYYAFMVVCSAAPHFNATSLPDQITLLLPSGERLSLPIGQPRSPFGESRELAVCVKPIHGEFDVVRMIEWLEIQKAAGLTDFILYDADLHGGSRFVVDYYRIQGSVTVVRFSFLLAILRVADRHRKLGPLSRYSLYQQTYLLAINDCLYRFRRSYRHLLIIDLDEVLLPTGDESVPEMLRRQRRINPDVASYVFPTAWHFREFRIDGDRSSLLYMQTYVRASPPVWYQPKSIVVTEYAILVNYHVAITSLSARPRHEVPWQRYGYVHHFRDGTCHEKFRFEKDDVCGAMKQKLRVDPVIKRYNIVTLKQVYRVMKYLQLG